MEGGVLEYFKEWPALLVATIAMGWLARMYTKVTEALQEQNRYTQDMVLKAFVDQTGKVAESTGATRELTTTIGNLHTSQEVMRADLNRLTGA
jgi:hypothetical protein